MTTKNTLSTIASCLFTLTACTTVSITPVDKDGTAIDKGVDGVTFYRPKPYLLITATSNDTKEISEDSEKNNTPQIKKSKEIKKHSDNLTLANCNYQIKLIYLPDFSHGYVISVNNWWRMFGTATMAPQLENGWMLKSLNSKVDSKTPETISAVAELATAVTGAVAGVSTNNDGSNEPTMICDPKKRIDGLYELEYKNGIFTNFKKHSLPINDEIKK